MILEQNNDNLKALWGTNIILMTLTQYVIMALEMEDSDVNYKASIKNTYI